MDNKKREILSNEKSVFEVAMKLATSSKNVVGYRIHKNKLILYRTKSDSMVELPYAMETDEVSSFVWGWLMKNKPVEPQPDHDGDNEFGFRILSENRIQGEWEAFVEIEPIWACYGK